MSFDIIRKTVRHIVDLIAIQRYDLVLKVCSSSRLTEADLEHAMNEYGVHAMLAPEDADQYIEAVAIKDSLVPTWSLWAPLWTQEEGRSDLILELTIAIHATHADVELDNLHVQ